MSAHRFPTTNDAARDLCAFTWTDGWASSRDPHFCTMNAGHKGLHHCRCDWDATHPVLGGVA